MAPKPSGAPPKQTITPAAINNLVVFSILMLLTPLALFWSFSEGYLDPLFAPVFGVPKPEHRTMISGIIAVLAVNLVVGIFIFVAFREQDAVPKSKKQD